MLRERYRVILPSRHPAERWNHQVLRSVSCEWRPPDLVLPGGGWLLTARGQGRTTKTLPHRSCRYAAIFQCLDRLLGRVCSERQSGSRLSCHRHGLLVLLRRRFRLAWFDSGLRRGNLAVQHSCQGHGDWFRMYFSGFRAEPGKTFSNARNFGTQANKRFSTSIPLDSRS